MGKYVDTSSAGHSPISPFKTGETPKQRHARRLNVNMKYAGEVEAFCQEHSISMVIKNNGHHWQFWFARRMVEWWPSSAKMVVDKQWTKGKHVHDARQLIQEMRRVMKENGYESR